MLAYCNSTTSSSGKNNSSSSSGSSAYPILQKRHTIHPENEICAFIHFMCILFHFLPFCSCDHVNYLRWTSIEFYWQTSTTKSESLKYLSWKRTTCTRRRCQKSTAINNLPRFFFLLFLARHLLRRKIWLTYILSKCMCVCVCSMSLCLHTVLVKDIHSVHKNLNSFPLGFDNKFSWSKNSTGTATPIVFREFIRILQCTWVCACVVYENLM